MPKDYFRVVMNKLLRTAFISFIVIGNLSTRLARGGVTLRAGDPVVIVLPKSPSATDRFAAAEITRYFKEMAQVAPAVETPLAGARAVIKLARCDDGSPAATQITQRAGQSLPDAYSVEISGNQITLRGGGDRGTLYAAYDLLESLGCRWIYPGTDIVPALAQLNLPDRDDVQVPAFVLREVDGDFPADADAGKMIDWLAKNRLNARFNLRPERLYKQYASQPEIAGAWTHRGGVMQWEWTAHNLSSMLPTDPQWVAQHQDFFALYHGRRVPPGIPGRPGYSGGMLCTTNPEVIQTVADWVNHWFDTHPNGYAVPLWPNDGEVKWCECPDCMALGGRNSTSGPEGSMSRRLVTFVNQVARRVAAKRPDRFVVLPAYSNYLDPVMDVPIEPNVIVQYVHHGNLGQAITHADNVAEAARMQAWAKLAPQRMGIWELGLIGDNSATGNQTAILPLLERYKLTLAWLNQQGFRYYYSQGNAAYHTNNQLLYWCIAKLLWNPNADLHLLIQDYCAAAYGAAGSNVAQFYEQLDESATKSGWYPRSYSDIAAPSPAIFTSQVIASSTALLDDPAAANTLTPPQASRLAQLRNAFDVCAAAVNMRRETGLDDQQPWRLARGKNAYVLNADGIDIDPKRFDDLVMTMQDQGRFDQSFKRTVFRARKRSEAVVTIQSKHLTVAVLPGVGGRILRLIDNQTGYNFLQEHPNGASDTLAHAGDAYFAYGGYEEYVGSGFAGTGWEIPFACKSVDTAAGKALELSAEFELPDGRVRLDRHIELMDKDGDPPAMVIRSTLTNLESATRRLSLRSHPLFSFGDDARDDEIYVRTATGTTHSSSKANDDGPATKPNGVWAAISPKSGRGIFQQYDPNSAHPYFFCDSSGRYFTLELFGEPRDLAKGESVVMEQRFTPAANRTALNDVMAQAFGADVALPASASPAASEAANPMR
jgi:hypothetical protein